MRCSRCGNENPAENRFCGMCGATLLSASAVGDTQTQRAASAGTTVPAPVAAAPARPVEPQRMPSREPEHAPVINGPSFLGLNDPAPPKRARLSIDPHGSRSRNLDYLLEDEEPHHGGAGKFILIIVALALAVGFGYLRWRNHGLPWLDALLNKPAVSSRNATPADNLPAPVPATPSITPEPQTPAASQPAAAPAQLATPSTPDGANGAANPASGTPPSNATPAASDTGKPKRASNPPPKADDSAENDESGDDNEPATPATKPAKPKGDEEAPAPKPRAAVAPAKPIDTVAEARKYLYGEGAPQDCDRGLRLLKPAANANNAKAMVEMGALYSAGLCTPRDLPTAYRWFALALRKEPDNQSVQGDLQKLWGEMTPPERQLAIRLTQ